MHKMVLSLLNKKKKAKNKGIFQVLKTARRFNFLKKTSAFSPFPLFSFFICSNCLYYILYQFFNNVRGQKEPRRCRHEDRGGEADSGITALLWLFSAEKNR